MSGSDLRVRFAGWKVPAHIDRCAGLGRSQGYGGDVGAGWIVGWKANRASAACGARTCHGAQAHYDPRRHWRLFDMDLFYPSWKDAKRSRAKKLDRLKAFVKFT
jgi:hypothetical protein